MVFILQNPSYATEVYCPPLTFRDSDHLLLLFGFLLFLFGFLLFFFGFLIFLFGFLFIMCTHTLWPSSCFTLRQHLPRFFNCFDFLVRCGTLDAPMPIISCFFDQSFVFFFGFLLLSFGFLLFSFWSYSIILLDFFYYPFGFLLLSFWIYSIILLDFLFSHLDFLFIVSISSFSNFDFFFSHLDFSFPRLDFLFHSVSGTASSSVLLIVAISLARSCTGSICTQRITLYLHLEKLKSKVNDFKQFCKRFYCFTKLKITARRTIVLI